MTLINIEMLIENHVFQVGDPVLVCGDREIPGVIVDASQEQLKVKLSDSNKNLYTTRCKTYTKPDISKIFQEESYFDSINETRALDCVQDEVVVIPEGEPLEQLLLF